MLLIFLKMALLQNPGTPYSGLPMRACRSLQTAFHLPPNSRPELAELWLLSPSSSAALLLQPCVISCPVVLSPVFGSSPWAFCHGTDPQYSQSGSSDAGSHGHCPELQAFGCTHTEYYSKLKELRLDFESLARGQIVCTLLHLTFWLNIIRYYLCALQQMYFLTNHCLQQF